MSLQLDARDVLHELNQLGYVNVTAEQLKEFMQGIHRIDHLDFVQSTCPLVFFWSDLKRLIKYEQKDSETQHKTFSECGPSSRVHQQFTKSKTDAVDCRQTLPSQTRRVRDQENQTSLDGNNVPFTNPPQRSTTQQSTCPVDRPTTASSSSSQHRHRQQLGVGRIPIPPLTTTETTTTMTDTQRTTTTTDHQIPLRPANHRRPQTGTASQPAPPKLVRNTPTDLYQYYQRDWHRFKQQLPGESSRSSVRQAVRRMMETEPPPKPRVYLALYEDQTKSIRRK